MNESKPLLRITRYFYFSYPSRFLGTRFKKSIMENANKWGRMIEGGEKLFESKTFGNRVPRDGLSRVDGKERRQLRQKLFPPR